MASMHSFVQTYFIDSLYLLLRIYDHSNDLDRLNRPAVLACMLNAVGRLAVCVIIHATLYSRWQSSEGYSVEHTLPVFPRLEDATAEVHDGAPVECRWIRGRRLISSEELGECLEALHVGYRDTNHTFERLSIKFA